MNSNHEKRIENSLTFNDVMDEALAEHQAEKARLKADEDAKYEREQEERRAKERQAQVERNRKRAVHLNAIAAVLRPLHSVQVFEDDCRITVDGVDCRYIIDWREDWSRGSGRFGWGSKPKGTESLMIGDYGRRGSRVRYPLKKDGTYAYKKIAEHLSIYAERQQSKAKLESVQKGNTAGVNALREDLGIEQYWGPMQVVPSMDAKFPVFVKIKIEKSMTYSDAKALHAALKKLGHVK